MDFIKDQKLDEALNFLNPEIESTNSGIYLLYGIWVSYLCFDFELSDIEVTLIQIISTSWQCNQLVFLSCLLWGYFMKSFNFFSNFQTLAGKDFPEHLHGVGQSFGRSRTARRRLEVVSEYRPSQDKRWNRKKKRINWHFNSEILSCPITIATWLNMTLFIQVL